jgi:alpha-beta hydrolase superfamily lysophospholipase
VIASSPWLVTVVQAPPLKAALARILDPILPTYTDRWSVEPRSLARDPRIGDAYERDPLVHDFITSRLYLAATEAGQWALDHAADFPLPLLLMHGTADRLTSWDASREFARRLGRKVTWRSWEGWYHELHNEPERRRIARVMKDWMNGRLENTRSSRSTAGQIRPRMRKSGPLRRKGA